MELPFPENEISPNWKRRLKKMNRFCPRCGKSIPIMMRGRYHVSCKKELDREKKTTKKYITV
jgi:hypothetical protein